MAGVATTSTGNTAVSDAPRQLPIVMVPGVMGSRLTRFEEKQHFFGGPTVEPIATWDPPAPFGFKYVGWQTHFTGLYLKYDCYPDEGWTARLHHLDDGYAQDAHRIGSWLSDDDGDSKPFGSNGTVYSILPDYYPLVYAMAGLLGPPDSQASYLSQLAEAGFAPKVYCAGYDFRQDNRRSAQTLEKIVNIACEECQSDRVILVAHSMGGLVSRYFARQHPDKVQALFLVASPSVGAPEAYLYLKDFHDDLMIATLNIDLARLVFDLAVPILGKTDLLLAKQRAQEFSRYHMPAIYQLAASDLYAVADNNVDWLEFDDAVADANQNPHIPSADTERAPVDCSDVNLLYANVHTGFLDYGSGQLPVQRDFLDSALAFHRSDLAAGPCTTPPDPTSTKAWMPSRTYVAYSKHHDTIVGVALSDDGETTQRLAPGDGSVPEASGRVSDDIVDGSPIVDRLEVASAEFQHSQIPRDAEVVQWVLDGIVTECLLMNECED